jgi:hypothetical protein
MFSEREAAWAWLLEILASSVKLTDDAASDYYIRA